MMRRSEPNDAGGSLQAPAQRQVASTAPQSGGLTLVEAEVVEAEPPTDMRASAKACREHQDDCGTGFVLASDAEEQPDANNAAVFRGSLNSDAIAVALGIAVLFQHTVCAAEGQVALVCGALTTLTTIAAFCAYLLQMWVFNSATHRVAMNADETEKFAAEQEKADRRHKNLCETLESLAHSLDDDKPLSQQSDLWREVVDQIYALEKSWRALHEAVRMAEYTHPQRRWADVRHLTRRMAQVAPRHLHMTSLAHAVQAHPLARFLSTERAERAASRSISVQLPMKANMNKLGAGTKNLKAIRSTWALRTFELTAHGLEWRLITSESGANHPNRKYMEAHELASVEAWTGSLGGVKVDYGLQLEVSRDSSGARNQIVYIDAMEPHKQKQWRQALHQVLTEGKRAAENEIEFARSCKLRGVELGRNRVAQFVLQGKHGKLLVQTALERARLDFDSDPLRNRQLYPGLQIRVRGTAVGERLPPAPKQAYLPMKEDQRRAVLTTFFLRKEADRFRLKSEATGSHIDEEMLEHVIEQVNEQEKQISNLAGGVKAADNAKHEAYLKVCEDLKYEAPNGMSVDPESLRRLVAQREIANWHDPRDVRAWGRLSSIATPDAHGGLGSGAFRHIPLIDHVDSSSLLNGSSKDSPIPTSTLDGYQDIIDREPGVCVVHELTNNTPYRLEAGAQGQEEFLARGGWSTHAPPPNIIDPGRTRSWGSTTSSRLFGSSGTGASLVYRGSRRNDHRSEDGAVLSKQGLVAAGSDAFDLILSHDCPESGYSFTPRDNRAIGVIYDSLPQPYSQESMRVHHKNTVHDMGEGKVKTGGNRTQCDENNVKVSVKITQAPSRQTGPPVLIIKWTLAPCKLGMDEQDALQTAAALASPDMQHRTTWMLEDLLPATQNQADTKGVFMVSKLSNKEFWIETFVAGVFNKAQLPRGPVSGWLQVQVAAGDSIGLGLKTKWLDVDVSAHSQAAEVGGTAMKYAPTEELVPLCVDHFKQRFSQTGNWREKLTQAMNDHTPNAAAELAAAHRAQIAAFAFEETTDLKEQVSGIKRHMHANDGRKVSKGYDVSAEGLAQGLPQTLGEAKLSGANTAMEGLVQTLEWKAIGWLQNQRAKNEAMQTLDAEELENYKKAKQAVAAQWLAATTPAEVTAAKHLKVVPKVVPKSRSQPQFNEIAALHDRRQWRHWQEASTGDVLTWVIDDYVDNVCMKKCSANIKKKLRKATSVWTAGIGRKLPMVMILQTMIMSHGKREQLLAYYVSVGHRTSTTLQEIRNDTLAAIEAVHRDAGFEHTWSPIAIVTGIYDFCAPWLPTIENTRHYQIVTVTVLALGLEVSRMEYESKLSRQGSYKLSSINNFGIHYYLICRQLLLIFTIAIQIKCYVDASDYAVKFAATICYVAIYRKLQSAIMVALAIWVTISCWYGFGQLVNRSTDSDDYVDVIVHYHGLEGSQASRPLLMLAHVVFHWMNSVLTVKQLTAELSMALLHITSIIGFEIAASVMAGYLDNQAALGRRLCRRVVHYCIVFTALLLCVESGSEPEQTSRLWGGMSGTWYQVVVLAAIVPLCIRVVEPLLAMVVRFVCAVLFAWQNIMKSASAIVFVLLVSQSDHHVQSFLDEILAPLPTAASEVLNPN